MFASVIYAASQNHWYARLSRTASNPHLHPHLHPSASQYKRRRQRRRKHLNIKRRSRKNRPFFLPGMLPDRELYRIRGCRTGSLIDLAEVYITSTHMLSSARREDMGPL